MEQNTTQEIFDKVATHLFTQGESAVEVLTSSGTKRCMYRNDKGQKCAIGCLIPDDVYDKKMEGKGSSELLEQFGEVLVNLKLHEDILPHLQTLHDEGFAVSVNAGVVTRAWNTTALMQEGLSYIAQRFDLTTDNIKDLKFEDR